MSLDDRRLKDLRDDGYVLVPNLFSKEEIEGFRSSVTELFDRGEGLERKPKTGGISRIQPDALNLAPELTRILKPEVIEIMKQVTGGSPHYCHHSDAHLNWTVGWHRDSIYGKPTYFDFAPSDIFENGPAGRYSVYKLALYLQDHSRDDLGISVIRGSHARPGEADDFPREDRVAVHSGLGDAVVFDTRLFHRGVDQISPSDRMSIFFTFARDDQMTREFVRGTIFRQSRQLGRDAYEPSAALVESLERAGIPMVPHEPRPLPSAEHLLTRHFELARENKRLARQIERMKQGAPRLGLRDLADEALSVARAARRRLRRRLR